LRLTCFYCFWAAEEKEEKNMTIGELQKKKQKEKRKARQEEIVCCGVSSG
jgi:hypothetical protein